MENSEEKAYSKSNLQIVEFAIRKWKLLVTIGIIAAIFGVVFSMPEFIPPKFKSEAIIYPANIGEYGGETEIEQMQQYLESNEIRDYIISKFNLYDEYEIDSAGASSKTYINQAYSENISFDETKFESIRITAISTDPIKARDIAAEIIKRLNLVIRKTEREKYKEIVVINEKMLANKKSQIDSLQNAVTTLSTEYGVLDFESQSERVTEKYMDFLLSGKKGKDFEEAKKLFDNLKKYGQEYQGYKLQLELLNEEYVNRLQLYELSVRNFEKFQTYSNVLVYPEVPDKKTSPIRWLIVLSSIVAAVGFTFVLLLIFGYQNR